MQNRSDEEEEANKRTASNPNTNRTQTVTSQRLSSSDLAFSYSDGDDATNGNPSDSQPPSSANDFVESSVQLNVNASSSSSEHIRLLALENKREASRLSSMRCQQRKRQRMEDLKEQEEKLKLSNQRLREQNNFLRAVIAHMRHYVSTLSNAAPTMTQQGAGPMQISTLHGQPIFNTVQQSMTLPQLTIPPNPVINPGFNMASFLAASTRNRNQNAGAIANPHLPPTYSNFHPEHQSNFATFPQHQGGIMPNFNANIHAAQNWPHMLQTVLPSQQASVVLGALQRINALHTLQPGLTPGIAPGSEQGTTRSQELRTTEAKSDPDTVKKYQPLGDTMKENDRDER